MALSYQKGPLVIDYQLFLYQIELFWYFNHILGVCHIIIGLVQTVCPRVSEYPPRSLAQTFQFPNISNQPKKMAPSPDDKWLPWGCMLQRLYESCGDK